MFINEKFRTQNNAFIGILRNMANIFRQGWTVIKDVVFGVVLIFIDLITGNFTKLKTDLQDMWRRYA